VDKIKRDKVYVADPAFGLMTYSKREFLDGWIGATRDDGTVLLLEPSRNFYELDLGSDTEQLGFRFLLSYLASYKKYIFQLVAGMFVGSLLQLMFPFLTQSLVDFGINNQNIGFVYTVLIAQLMLFVSRVSVEFIRSWILLHLGIRINISIISDFLTKLMKLPLSFFDTKMIGDILQRIGDNNRVQMFLTSTILNIAFAIMNLVVFGLVLATYSTTIFGVFLLGSVALSAWILIFMKRRRELDYKRFDRLSENQSTLIQLINGMQEIRLNGAERQKRWEWERIQAKVFRISVKGLLVNQYQQAGVLSINELKNIVISFLAAKEVIDGSMTLGMMMAVTYIIGQLSSPIDQILSFIQTAQDAKISLDRLGEIHGKSDEESPHDEKAVVFPRENDIVISRLSFQYGGAESELVLKDLSLSIPSGKTTALVGVSGSGKTTLVKLLLKIYSPTAGEIRVGDVNLSNLSAKLWRQKCGVVMQDGFIFSDSIAKNVALGVERIDNERLHRAAESANIREFIESLPHGYATTIGPNGHGLSQGQRQRILIARAVYKNPELLFFDEATSALDAGNEEVIMANLEKSSTGRTTVIIAHRLSTVKKADQIIVIDKGRIVECGTHLELTEMHNAYYNLVKNQLELGN
jgi:ATP-binding cassette subfamily B protein